MSDCDAHTTSEYRKISFSLKQLTAPLKKWPDIVKKYEFLSKCVCLCSLHWLIQGQHDAYMLPPNLSGYGQYQFITKK